MSNGGIIGPANDPVNETVSAPGSVTTFNSSGTFTPFSAPATAANFRTANVLVVAGGRGGGSNINSGGGAGFVQFNPAHSIPASAAPVTVGSGGGNNGNGGDDVYTNAIIVPATVPVDFEGLFFSEYAEGSSYNKYLEIYNGTGDVVSLDDVVILGNYNGNPWSETFTFQSGATIAVGDVYIVASSDADPAIIALADEVHAYADPWYITAFNGDDVRALATVNGEETTIIDIIGTLDTDGDGVSGEGGDDDLIRMVPGGCICCVGNMAMGVALADLIRKVSPARLLIEPTGLGHPAGVLDLLREAESVGQIDLRATICLVDPRRLAEINEAESEIFQDQIHMADALIAPIHCVNA